MKYIQIRLFLFIAIFSSSLAAVTAQNKKADTLEVKEAKVHSPRKATLMSTAVPGLGQVYNKKYWKVPIVYASMGTSLYFAFTNHAEYKEIKNEFISRTNGELPSSNFDIYTDDNLRTLMDYHQRNRDFSYILAGIFYVLNIADATVDAYLFNFPKNDDLSFMLKPSIQLAGNHQINKGITLVINL